MKVLKFGGTSVGSVKSILSLKEIVEAEARTQPVVVVVSALGGITDKLIATSQMALKRDKRYREELDAIVERHHQMIDTIITDPKKRENLFKRVDSLFEQLKSIYFGVYLIHDLSRKTEDAIVSYGERLSSNIVAALIKNGIRMNSRDFIRTKYEKVQELLPIIKARLAEGKTQREIAEEFGLKDKYVVQQLPTRRWLLCLDSSAATETPARPPIWDAEARTTQQPSSLQPWMPRCWRFGPTWTDS